MFLDKKNTLINTNLTNKGKKSILNGSFNIKYYAFGDTEIDYLEEDHSILKAFSNYNNIKDIISYNTNDCSLIDVDENSVVIKDYNIKGSNSIYGTYSDENNNGDVDDFCLRSDLLYDYGVLSSVNGNTIDLNDNTLEDGDILLMVFYSGSTPINCSITEPALVIPYIITVSPPSTILQVDKDFPLGYNTIKYYVYKKSTLINNDVELEFDNVNLKFKKSCDDNCKNILKFNIINLENIAGSCSSYTLEYDSCGNEIQVNDNVCEEKTFGDQYKSIAKYLGYYSNCGEENITSDLNCEQISNSTKDNYVKSIGIIYIEDSCCTTDIFSNDLELYLPQLMYHRRLFGLSGSANAIGMKFVSDIFEKTINGIKYYDLLEDQNITSQISIPVGKIFPELKVVVIEDAEILNALSICSNRNYTLPCLKGTFQNNNFNNGFLKPNQQIYITYRLNDNTIHNSNYITLSNTLSTSKDINITIEDINLLPYPITNNDIYLIYQVVSLGERPNPCEWKELNMGGTSLALETGFFILNNDSDVNSINYNNNIEQNCIGKCGDDEILFGSIKVSQEKYFCNYSINIEIDSDNIVSSKNCTYNNCDNPIISEIGLYNSNEELMFISKLSNPIHVEANKIYNVNISYNM